MLETPVQVRSQARAAETVERHAHILWTDLGSGGHGYLRADSRAFSPLPVSPAGRSHRGSPDTTPGELLAAAVCSSFAVTLAELLARRETPAQELAVDATCELAESQSGQTISGIHLRVRRRGAGLEPDWFAESVQLALARCPVSHSLSATVDITVDADLGR
jgi:lipoyl-dependent peroxiredoxin